MAEEVIFDGTAVTKEMLTSEDFIENIYLLEDKEKQKEFKKKALDLAKELHCLTACRTAFNDYEKERKAIDKELKATEEKIKSETKKQSFVVPFIYDDQDKIKCLYENVESVLKNYFGVKLNYCTVTKKSYFTDIDDLPYIHAYEIKGIDNSQLATFLSNWFIRECDCNRFKTEKMYELLNYIALKNKTNRVKEHLNQFPKWKPEDKDYLQELWEILHIDDINIGNNELYQTMIQRWLMQCICILNNNLEEPFGAETVLILQGKQGIGKTQFFRKMAMKPMFFNEGQTLDTDKKDDIITAFSAWITELGEIESTFRKEKNTESLKAIITKAVDTVRPPYGKTFIDTPRQTSLCGSCNSEDILKDRTGNRRYQIVKLDMIDLNRLRAFNVEAMWKEVEYLVGTDYQSFRLTPEEIQQSEENNKKYLKKLPAQQELEDLIADVEKDESAVTVEITATGLKNLYNTNYLKDCKVPQIGKALQALGYKSFRGRIYRFKVHGYAGNQQKKAEV